MKFINSLKFIAILLVISSVFTKRISRSKTVSKVKTLLDKMAEVKSYCLDGTKSDPPGVWLYLDTDSVKGGKSGFIVKNYYKKESFNCKYMNPISDSDSRKRYFSSFRDFSMYNDAYGVENNWTKMRAFVFQMTGGVAYVFNIDKFLISSSSINDKELVALVKTIQTNKNSYMRTFHNYRNSMISLKGKAEALTELKALNLNTKEALQAEIEKKKKELAASQTNLKNLNTKAESLRFIIRDYEKQITIKKSSELDPKMENLKVQVQTLESLSSQIAENDKKIQGIIPIDQNDLAQSSVNLKAKLTDLRALYLSSDPKYALFTSVINSLATKMDEIPQVIA